MEPSSQRHLSPIPAVRSSLCQSRTLKLSNCGMSFRRKATFLTHSVTRHVQELPTGKNAMSPLQSRLSTPFTVVMKTSPEMI